MPSETPSNEVVCVDVTSPAESATALDINDSNAGAVKRGHSCFGCCCDMRSAVIMCDIFLIVTGILMLSLETYGLERAHTYASDEESNDDYTFAVNDDSLMIRTREAETQIGAFMLLTLMYVMAAVISLFGAMTFQGMLVALNVVVLVARAVVYLMFRDWFAMACPVLFCYPHIMFIVEVRNGILQQDTYQGQEEQSCCCVSERVAMAFPSAEVM